MSGPYAGLTGNLPRDPATGALLLSSGGSKTSNVLIPALAGIDGWAYGHSYFNVQATPNCSPGSLYRERLRANNHMNSLTNLGVNGYTAEDVANTALGGGSTSGAWLGSNYGLVLVDLTQNSLRLWANDAQGRTSYTHALRSLLWLLSCANRTENTAATFPSGTWTSGTPGTPGDYSGGTIHFSSDAGATARFTLTGTDFVLFVHGTGATGGAIDVQVDGVTKASQSLLNQARTSDSALASARVPIAIPLLGLSNASHNIDVIKTDAAGTNINVDCVMVPRSLSASNALGMPTIVVVKQQYLPSSIYTGWGTGATDASVDAFNAIIDTVAAEFAAYGNVLVANPASYGWDRATCTTSGHPNDRGMAVIFDSVAAVLSTQTYRLGLNKGV